MTPQPTELPDSSVPGMSSAQASAIYKSPFTDGVHRVPKLGAGIPRTLLNGVGLWYWGSTPFGDWSGTSQEINEAGDPGSGGPALCPYPMGGDHTIVAAGHIYSKTGATGMSTTSAVLDRGFPKNISSVAPYNAWTYTVAIRKITQAVIGWNSGASSGSKIAANVATDPVIPGCDFTAATLADPYPKITAPSGEDWDAYTFTGDDWIVVQRVAPIGTVLGHPGWYRIKAKNSSTELELTGDASFIYDADTTVDVYLLQSAQAKYVTGVEYFDTVQLTLAGGTSFPADLDTLTVNGRVYTFKTSPSATDDILRAIPADGVTLTTAERNAFRTRISDALGTNPEVEVVSSSGANINFRSATRDRYSVSESATGLTLSAAEISRGELFKSSGFDTLVSTDDTVEILSGGSANLNTYCKIQEGTANSLWVDDFDVANVGAADINVIQFKRFAFVERPVVVASCTQTKVVWTGTLGTSHGWNDDTPKRGDILLVWADTVDSGTTQLMTTNPESTPTFTQRNNTWAAWPYGSPVPSSVVPHPANYGNVPSSDYDSQINSGYHGNFIIPAECFVAGDKLEITTLSDFSCTGTPMILEALLIFGFDPEADWVKDGTVENAARLLESNQRMYFFQSAPFFSSGNHGLKITMNGQAGSVQTIGQNETGDNYSQQWTCTFEIYGDPNDSLQSGSNGGGANRPMPGFPQTVGPVAHICLTNVEAFQSENYPVTILYKTEHPSMRHKAGYHGHYAMEPFSCTTGCGGNLLTYYGVGTRAPTANSDGQFVAELPYGGAWRVAAVSVTWTPGGSH